MSATFGSCLQKPAPADQLIVAAIYVIPAPPPAYDAERVAVNQRTRPGSIALHGTAAVPSRSQGHKSNWRWPHRL